MGLTIHYRFEFRGTKSDLRGRLESLHRQICGLSAASVGPLHNIASARLDTGYGSAPDDEILENQLGYMMAFQSFLNPAGAEKTMLDFLTRIGGIAELHEASDHVRDRYTSLRQEALVATEKRKEKILRAGNGLAFDVKVGAGCEPFRVMLGRLGSGRVWRGQRFTKTQCAVQFVDCHLAVIRMLELCEQVGILEYVNDEGQSWELRNLSDLDRNISASTDALKELGGA